ncbi:MAG: hypothetical protein GX606_03625 [Elusimicrobia bacterium]|nr:hypothetical protein [Elusimicrobiota bacterium]
MRKILCVLCVFGFVGSASLVQAAPDLEAGKGDLAVENICRGTTGEVVQKTFHPNGSLHVKAYCKDGVFHGTLKKYHPNAKIQMKAVREREFERHGQDP